MTKDILKKLYQSKQTVFSFKDISLILGETNKDNLKSKIAYYVKNNDLLRLRKGIYALDKDYDRLELATKIYTPSYISFETVLAKEGVTFQYYERIFVASYLSREIEVDKQTIEYVKIKKNILVNRKGLIDKGSYYIASPERAFLDRIYTVNNYYFDNPETLDRDKAFDLVKIYNSENMGKQIKKIFNK